MRVIPEYEPVDRLFLSFVQNFFHSRFNYGQTICEIVRAVSGRINVEIFVAKDEEPLLRQIMEVNGLRGDMVTMNHSSPLRGIVAEYFPIFCEDGNGRGVAIHFRNDKLDLADFLHVFSGDIINVLELEPLRMLEGFATARIAVNEDLCLLSEDEPIGAAAMERLEFFRVNFPVQRFVQVPSLSGDATSDLDMFLWPVKPCIWLVSEYPEGTLQERSVRPSLEAIREHGHEAVMIPGLPRIHHDDVDAMPNYANGLLINGTALCPAYGRAEDETVARILESYGYDAVPVDCTRIIESNSGLHCISKTVPSSIMSLPEARPL